MLRFFYEFDYYYGHGLQIRAIGINNYKLLNQ